MAQNLNQLEQELLDTRTQEMKIYNNQMQSILLKLNSPRFEITALDMANMTNNITHLLHETKDVQHRRALLNLINLLDKMYTKCNLMQKLIDDIEKQNTKN